MPNILIVDDSSTMRKIIYRSLRQAGFVVDEILEAGDGVEGMNALAANTIDLIQSDINMPNMDGLEFAEGGADPGRERLQQAPRQGSDGQGCRQPAGGMNTSVAWRTPRSWSGSRTKGTGCFLLLIKKQPVPFFACSFLYKKLGIMGQAAFFCKKAACP